MASLLQYDYPGNVRELKNIIERLVVLADDDCIRLEDIAHYNVFSDSKNVSEGLSLKAIRSQAEKDHIQVMLQDQDYDMDRTAQVLEISSRQLYNKVKEYGIRLK